MSKAKRTISEWSYNLPSNTSNAAYFSETNNDVFPTLITFAIMFAIVSDFPVPGGPWIKVSSFNEDSTAYYW